MDTLINETEDELRDLPADVQTMISDAESDLTSVGVDVPDVDVEADLAELAATESSVEVPSKQKAPTSFTSRGAARTAAKSLGYKVVDKGAKASKRWHISAPSTRKPTKRRAHTAPATVSKPGKKSTAPAAKKTVAIEVYRNLESKGELKRSTFISLVSSRTGLSEKGASSYFYRIKGGKW